MKKLVIGLTLVLALSACDPVVKTFDKETFPKRLSDWGIVFIDNGSLVPNKNVFAYDLNTPLFTDYAHKFRTIWVPEGKTAQYSKAENIQLPIGSVVSKTFFYPRDGDQLLQNADESDDYNQRGLDMSAVRLIETRLMVRLQDGWQGLPYVWAEDQKDAYLEIAGDAIQLQLKSEDGVKDLNYLVPDFNQCQGCHIENLDTKEMKLLGVKGRHIDKSYAHLHQTNNQIDYLESQGVLDFGEQNIQANALWLEDTSSQKALEHKARSYLDINCGHCHNPKGAGDTSGLFLNIEETDSLKLGICKPPVAAGQGTGGRLVGIKPGDAEASILTYRMESLDLGAMMPELGRSLVHKEGLELISEWIDGLQGEC